MIPCRCSNCFRKIEDGRSLDISIDGKTYCPFCGSPWEVIYSLVSDRETVLRFFREFPRGRHEWEMDLQEKHQFINCVDTLETLLNSHDGELFCEAALSIGYGLQGGIFEQLIAVLKQDRDFLRLGIAETKLNLSPNEYLRYAAMLCSKKREFLEDPSSRIRAAAINLICDKEDLPAKDPAGQNLCMIAAKKLDDEFASLQMDYLFGEFGGSVFVTPSFRYPESKAFGVLGRILCFLGGGCVVIPLAGFAGYWIGRYAQWRIKDFVIPDAQWWFAGILMAAALYSLVLAYPQWVKEEKDQKAKGRMKRDWLRSKSLKKALKRYSRKEIRTTILLGNPDGLEAIVFTIPDENLTYVTSDGRTAELCGEGGILDSLLEALRFSANFMIPCQQIVYPCPGFVTINIYYPHLGFLVMEERIDAMQDGNTLVGEVFAVTLPKLYEKTKSRLAAVLPENWTT